VGERAPELRVALAERDAAPARCAGEGDALERADEDGEIPRRLNAGNCSARSRRTSGSSIASSSGCIVMGSSLAFLQWLT
jgi:hypothetical protein